MYTFVSCEANLYGWVASGVETLGGSDGYDV